MKLTKLYDFIIRGNIIMIHNKNKNNNNQGVFLELLVAVKNEITIIFVYW